MLPASQRVHNVKYAGIWQRTLAAAIDEVIICSLQCLLGLAFFCFCKELYNHTMVKELWRWIQSSSILGSICLIIIPPLVCAFIIIPWLYVALYEASSAQATPGQRILNLTVAKEGGERISFIEATKKLAIQYMLLPALVLLVSAVTCSICQGRICGILDIYVSFYMTSLILSIVIPLVSLGQILFTETRQTVIDKLCRRLVLVRKPDSPTLSDGSVWFGAIAVASAILGLGLAVDPNDWQAFYNRSIRESRLGQHKEALRDYVKAVNMHIPEWNKTK